VIAEDVRMAKTQMLLDGPGYVLPADVRLQLSIVDTSWTIAVAEIAYAGFKPAIEPTEADLGKFYQDNAFRYEIPPRVSVDFLDFPAEACLEKVKLAEADVRAYYDANPAHFPAPAKTPAKLGSAKATDEFDAVRPKVEAALRQERARRLAAKEASDVAYALYESKIDEGPALDAFLASRKLARKPLAPFTQEAGPAELGGSAEIADAAFKLDSSNFYSDALPGPSGSVLLIWKAALPSRQPLLAEVKDKVRADYVEEERRKRFVALGADVRGRVAASLAAGVPFEKAVSAAAAAVSLKIDVKKYPAFTLRDRPKDVDPAVFGALTHLDKGSVSDMMLDADKGRLVCALDKKVPDLAETGPRFAQMRASIAYALARIGAKTTLDEMVAQELKRTEPKVQ
jgi:peptidyl-prolyl cis-trans isomerase D